MLTKLRLRRLATAVVLTLCLVSGAEAGAGGDDATAPPPSSDQNIVEPALADLFQAVKAASAAATEAAPGVPYVEVSLPDFGIRLHAWSFDQGKFALRAVAQADEHGLWVKDIIGKGDILAINGGFFDRDKAKRLTPSGLLIVDGKTVARERPGAGSGIVFSGPSGVGIGYRKTLADRTAMRQAIQVGPILVDPGGTVGILDKQHDRQNRSAVCVSGDVFHVFAVEGGISLFQLASVLAAPKAKGGFGCDVALNLDGGPSTQAIFHGASGDIAIDGGSSVQNALIVSRKAP